MYIYIYIDNGIMYNHITTNIVYNIIYIHILYIYNIIDPLDFGVRTLGQTPTVPRRNRSRKKGASQVWTELPVRNNHKYDKPYFGYFIVEHYKWNDIPVGFVN